MKVLWKSRVQFPKYSAFYCPSLSPRYNSVFYLKSGVTILWRILLHNSTECLHGNDVYQSISYEYANRQMGVFCSSLPLEMQLHSWLMCSPADSSQTANCTMQYTASLRTLVTAVLHSVLVTYKSLSCSLCNHKQTQLRFNSQIQTETQNDNCSMLPTIRKGYIPESLIK